MPVDPLTHYSLLLFTFAFGMCFAALALCIACWIKERELWQFKIILFIIYFTFLFFLEALYYYLSNLLRVPSQGGVKVFLLFRDLGYALFLYYLGATINYIRRSPWKITQLALVILAGLLYFAGGVIIRFKGSPPLFSSAMPLLLFSVQAYLLVDSARSIKNVSEIRLRISLMIVLLVPLFFLPLLLVFQSFFPDRPALNFVILSMFYFWLALGAVIFFLQPLAIVRSGGELNLSSENVRKFGLTEREIEIIRGIDRGLSYKEIASELDISPNTVSNHITRIYRKTGIRSKVELLKRLQ